MDISPTTTTQTPANLPDRQLPLQNARADEINEAAKKFEALLLRQFVEEAFKPMFGKAMAGGAGKDVYQYLMTDALAKNLSQSHSFGFSSLVQMQLAGSPAPSNDRPSQHGT